MLFFVACGLAMILFKQYTSGQASLPAPFAHPTAVVDLPFPTAAVALAPAGGESQQAQGDVQYQVAAQPTGPPAVMPGAAASVAAPTSAPTAAPTDLPPMLLLPAQSQAAAVAVPTAVPAVPAQQSASGPPDPAAAARIPILMYHYVRSVDPNADPMGYNLSVDPGLFGAHLDWLQQQGYTTVRMDQLDRCLNGQERCPDRAVALTFDDGYADAYTTVLPALQQRGFVATFYIVSGFVGHGGYMGWPELAALRDAGMEIGAHSIDHLNLTTLDLAEINRQVAQSKTDLETNLGITITSFCYPAGFYDANVVQAVASAGYVDATTTRWDNDASNILALPRRRIAGGTGVDGFASIMGG